MLYSVVFVWLMSIGPAVVFTVAGFALFRRDRALASVFVVIGFVAVLISQTAGHFASYEVSYVYRSSGALAAPNVRFDGWLWTFARFAGPVGMWLASIGLLWHVLSSAAIASPNNPWRGP